jgi:YVTN family beta-propeller protein
MLKISTALIISIIFLSGSGSAVSVDTIDFLKIPGVNVNAAGPLLVRMDARRNRLLVANTLSSSFTVIDCAGVKAVNIPLDGRAYQHLKTEAMCLDSGTGDVLLIGQRCFYMISPDRLEAETVLTGVQFESIAIDEKSGNVFLAGRESGSLGFYDVGRRKLGMIEWQRHSEPLINLNATPPPPIRKIIVDQDLGLVIAVDGFTSSISLFGSGDGGPVSSRSVALQEGGRWHLAGYDGRQHNLYIVTETDRRKVIEAAKISIAGKEDLVVELPGYTEGVGMVLNHEREEIYIGYDNHASVHVVDFSDGGVLEEIEIPAYGNDAAVLDMEKDLLYIASWAHGEIDIIDIEGRKLDGRFTGLGIIPHMFSMALNPNDGSIYFPKGASAVNGTFGAAISVFDPVSGELRKIRTGWAPVDIIENLERESFLVFSSEDQFVEVSSNGGFEQYDLPFDYPVCAVPSPDGNIYLSYGPHQSYWPTVYIWDAKNGILTIDSGDLSFYDRRIPRQAHAMVLGSDGTLYFTQNNWGREEQFVGLLPDEIRLFEAGQRLRLGDEVERETTQRLLEYDEGNGMLYLVRTGESDDDPGILQVIDTSSDTVVARLELGLTATDMVFDERNVYVTNFDSGNISVIDKERYSTSTVETGGKPLRLCIAGGNVYSIDHEGKRLRSITGRAGNWKIPGGGRPDNIFVWNDHPVISTHSATELRLVMFDPGKKKMTILHRYEYPYGDTSYDTDNVSFYMRGQFGDAIFDITKGVTGTDGRLRVIDFLSGKMFVLGE